MSVCVTAIVMSNQDERLVPGEVTLTFSNGEKATYERSYNEVPSSGNQLAGFSLPKYDLGDVKISEYTFEALGIKLTEKSRFFDVQYTAAVNEADRLLEVEKSKIKNFYDRRCASNDQLYATLSEEILEDYKSLKKEIDGKVSSLKHPTWRIKIMTEWLRKMGGKELIQAAQMLDLEADFIAESLDTAKSKWNCFISHVQKRSTDVCRNIKDNLEKKGISVWMDKTAGRVDKHGMVEGVVDSDLFLLILTKDYFTRPYCIFEYCLAVVAGRPVITISESDPNFGGGKIGSFKLNGLFGHLIDHEFAEINRTYWNAFISRLYKRIKVTLSESPKIMVRETLKTSEVVIDNEEVWNTSKMLSSELKQHDDLITISKKKASLWPSQVVGRQEFSNGRHSFTLEVIQIQKNPILLGCAVAIGVVPSNYTLTTWFGFYHGWGYIDNGRKAHESGKNELVQYGESYGCGDTITVELDFDEKTIVFYKNGRSLGVAFKNLTGPVYPAVSLASSGDCVRLKTAQKAC